MTRLRLLALLNAITLLAGVGALVFGDFSHHHKRVVAIAAPTTLPPTTAAPTTEPPTTAAAPPPPCSGAPPQTDGRESEVAQANGPRVEIFDSRGGSKPTRSMANPQAEGAPLTFLVQDDQGDWLKVLLPVRPNGSTGWIQRSQVTVTRHDYRIFVELSNHCITVFKGTSVFDREPVGVGTSNTPTPGGLYYLTVLFQPPDPNGAYGPYAYELSGFSDVLPNFEGGNGNLGIHGTNEPQAIGTDVSHGCIRMSNDGITKLAHALPLGVPVEVRP
jgi:lipoprotein-anchoring transpeptidase ErfK/SrfK